MGNAIKTMPYVQVSQGMRQMSNQLNSQMEQMKNPQIQQMIKAQPDGEKQVEEMANKAAALQKAVKFLDYLEQNDPAPAQPGMMNPNL